MGIRLQELIVPFKADTSGFAKAVTGGVLATIAAVGTAMVSAFVATEKWADEMDGLGDVMGGTNEQLAAFAYTARVSKVGTEAFTKANVFLEKSLLKSNGQLDVGGKKLKQYGINVKDVNGKVKDQATLTQEIADKYKTFATQQEKVNFLTEIYGKQGAQLIDFFDVLNGEGGVGTLAQKMKDLGLAIDPARYEKFNQNIERLKMLGLALAVAFTEKLMPVLERFMAWVSDVAANPAFREWVTKIGDFVVSIPDLLVTAQEALRNFDTKKFAEDAINFGKNIDWKKISDDLIAGIQNIDWNAAGQKIGEMVDKILDIVGGIALGLYEAIKGAIEQVDWPELFYTITEATLNFIDGLAGNSSGHLISMFNNWVLTIRAKFVEINVNFVLAFAQILTTIVTSCQTIGLVFMQKAGGWISGVIGRIREIKEGLFREIQSVVNRINAILATILQPNINFSIGTTGGNKRKHGGEITGFASGTDGWRTVPSGYSNDSFPIGLTSGETFAVVPKGKEKPNEPVMAVIDEKKLARVLRTELQVILASL